LDLSVVDVGAHLEQVLKTQRPARRIVLHLFRSLEGKSQPTGPIRLKDVDLVLFFEPPPKKEGVGPGAAPPAPRRLVLQADSRRASGALLDVEGGNVELIGGEIRLPDFAGASQPDWLVKLKGGSLR